MSTVVHRLDHAVTNDLGPNETVMLDIERGVYFGVRDVGRAIWDRLASPSTVQELHAELLSMYDVDGEVCRKELVAFLEQLSEAELIGVEREGSDS